MLPGGFGGKEVSWLVAQEKNEVVMGVIRSIRSRIKFGCGKTERGQGAGRFRGQKSWLFCRVTECQKEEVCVWKCLTDLVGCGGGGCF